MNTSLLRQARRYRGIYYWTLPGWGNGAKLIPERLSFKGWGMAFQWPACDHKGEHIRGVDLDRHKSIARQAVRELIAQQVES